MCDPMTIAGVALSGASVVAGQIAQGKAEKARSEVMAQERQRQRALDQEAATINARSQDRFLDVAPNMEKRSQELGDYIKGQAPADQSANEATQGMTAPVSSSNIAVQEEGRQRGKARAATNKQGEALGNLRSFGDVLGTISRGQARDSGYVGQVGGFKKGLSALIPAELETANQAGAGVKMFGDLLGMGGQLAIGKGLQGNFVGPATEPLAPIPGAAAAAATGNGVQMLPPMNPFRGPPPLPPANPFRIY